MWSELRYLCDMHLIWTWYLIVVLDFNCFVIFVISWAVSWSRDQDRFYAVVNYKMLVLYEWSFCEWASQWEMKLYCNVISFAGCICKIIPAVSLIKFSWSKKIVKIVIFIITSSSNGQSSWDPKSFATRFFVQQIVQANITFHITAPLGEGNDERTTLTKGQ